MKYFNVLLKIFMGCLCRSDSTI